MKIAFFVNRLGPGGAERTITYLSDYFAKMGHEVSIVIDSYEVTYPLNPKVTLICLDIPSEYPRSVVKKALFKFLRYLRQRKTLRKLRPDAVVSIPTASAELICSSKRRYGFRLVASERENPEFADQQTMRKKKKVLKYADGVIFQTERARSFYPQDIRDRSVVIANAIGNPLVYSVGNVTKREKKVVAIGRLHPDKGYDTLIRAFKTVAERHPEYVLEIYGDGPEKDKLVGSAAALGLENNVSFMGNRVDAIVCAVSASCYVLSSLHEGMPNALMEAMAVGLPCVSTNCPNGPDELINDGENGILVPVGDEHKMAIAILRMIEDREFAESCGRKAREIAKTNSVGQKAEEYLRYILSGISEPGGQT